MVVLLALLIMDGIGLVGNGLDLPGVCNIVVPALFVVTCAGGIHAGINQGGYQHNKHVIFTDNDIHNNVSSGIIGYAISCALSGACAVAPASNTNH